MEPQSILLQQAVPEVATAVYGSRDALVSEGLRHRSFFEGKVACLERQLSAQQVLLYSIQTSINTLAASELALEIPGPLAACFKAQAQVSTLSIQLIYANYLMLYKQVLAALPNLSLTDTALDAAAALRTPLAPATSPAPLPTAGPPAYTLFAAKTVADAWREWDEGILGGPAVRDLEATWGHL